MTYAEILSALSSVMAHLAENKPVRAFVAAETLESKLMKAKEAGGAQQSPGN